MRHLWIPVFLGAAACTPQSVSRPPPTDAFYFPSGIVYVESPFSPEGILYVASSNYDKRYDSGSVISVPLSGVNGGRGLQNTIGVNPAPPIQIDDLGPAARQVAIQSFAGEMAGFSLGDTFRLFVPTRAEGDLLEIVDSRPADGSLSCLNGGTQCLDPSLSLTKMERAGDGKPRAPEPVGVGISNEGAVYVTHLKGADSPPKSNRQLETYVVSISARAPVIDVDSFISLGFASLGGGPSTSSVAVGSRFAYLSSRYLGPGGAMIWLVDRGNLVLYAPGLEASYRTLEARGLALGSGEQRLYVAGRNPDTLIVVGITNPTADAPVLRVLRAVPLPEGTNQVQIISRRNVPGTTSDLVVVTSSTAGVVSIYDDGPGRLVAQIANIGVQPFGLATRIQKDPLNRRNDKAATIFVSNFGDGRIAVVDIADLAQPQNARLVAYLGKQQTCLVQDQDASCLGGTP